MCSCRRIHAFGSQRNGAVFQAYSDAIPFWYAPCLKKGGGGGGGGGGGLDDDKERSNDLDALICGRMSPIIFQGFPRQRFLQTSWETQAAFFAKGHMRYVDSMPSPEQIPKQLPQTPCLTPLSQIWWVQRTPYNYIVQKKKSLDIFYPPCTFDTVSDRYLPFAEVSSTEHHDADYTLPDWQQAIDKDARSNTYI
jgi:hypothetical protein